MDRRDVLKFGALASVSGSGCAALLGNPGAVSSGELGGFLSALDDAMKGIGGRDFFAEMLGPKPDPELVARTKAGAELTRKTMRSLLLVGSLSELPPEQLAHESVQMRLRDSMGEIDDAMFGMTSLLENLTPADRAEISKALNDDPQLGMRLMGSVEEEAASFGVSFKQRTRLRRMSAHVTARLRNSTDLTVAEYAGKMQKLASRNGGFAAAQRERTTSLATQMLWQAEATGGTSEVLSPPPPPPDVLEPLESPGTGSALVPEKKQGMRGSHVWLTVGGIALGLAGAAFGVGFAIRGGAELFGGTIGVLLGLSGLICLIIGLAKLAAGK